MEDYDRRQAAQDPWLTTEDVFKICPSCAEKMASLKVRKIKASALFQAAWESLPKGWTEESLKSMWNTMTGDVKHKVSSCMRKMEGKVDDPGAFCASLADKILGRTDWRGPD